MQGHLVFLKLSHLLIICPTLQIHILCMSMPMTYYTSCFQKKSCSCWQICGPLDGSGILRQWLGKFLCSPRRSLLGTRAEGQQWTKSDTLSTLDVYGKGGISLVVNQQHLSFVRVAGGHRSCVWTQWCFPICCLQAVVKGPQGKNFKFSICSCSFGLGTNTETVFGVKTAFLHCSLSHKCWWC